MSDSHQQLNVIAFDDHLRAQELLLACTRLAEQGHLAIVDAVVVTKSPDGHAHAHETTELTPAEGALGGGFWGLLIGTLLLGPIGGVVTGAVTAGGGALLTDLIDRGVSRQFVKQIKTELQANSAALILLTDHTDLEALDRELARFAGATLLWSNLPADARAAVEAALAAGATPPGG